MPKLRRIRVPCRFGEESGTFVLYLGEPATGFDPHHFQVAWLRETRGGAVAPEVLAALTASPARGASTREGDRS